MKMFYIPEGLCSAEPKRGQIVFTYVLLVFEEVVGVSNFAGVKGLLKIFKIFHTPKGLCSAEPERCPIVSTLNFIGVGRGTGGLHFFFFFLGGGRPFLKYRKCATRGFN